MSKFLDLPFSVAVKMMVQHVRRCREFTGPTPHSVAIVSFARFSIISVARCEHECSLPVDIIQIFVSKLRDFLRVLLSFCVRNVFV